MDVLSQQYSEGIKMNSKYHALTSLSFVLILAATWLSACSGPAASSGTVASATPKAGLANPASVFCTERGGRLNITTDATGGQVGQCIFPDGSQCEEWAFYQGKCAPGPSQAATAASSANLTEAMLKNGKYELPDIKTVQLVDGKFESKYGEGASQVNRGELTRTALGDLNGDGAPDGVVILTVNTGGSGVFVYMLVVVNRNGSPQQVAAEKLGDRVNVQNLAVKEGQIVLDALGFAPGDPMCCPSQSVIRTYRLQGNALQVVSEAKPTVTPQPSGATQVIVLDPRSFKLDSSPTSLKATCEASTVVPRTGAYKCTPAGGSNLDPCFVVEGNTLVCNLNPVVGSHSLVTATNSLPKGGTVQDKPVAFFLELESRYPTCIKRGDFKELSGQPVLYSCQAPGAWLVGNVDTTHATWVVQYVTTDSQGAQVTFGPQSVNVVRAWTY